MSYRPQPGKDCRESSLTRPATARGGYHRQVSRSRWSKFHPLAAETKTPDDVSRAGSTFCGSASVSRARPAGPSDCPDAPLFNRSILFITSNRGRSSRPRSFSVFSTTRVCSETLGWVMFPGPAARSVVLRPCRGPGLRGRLIVRMHRYSTGPSCS